MLLSVFPRLSPSPELRHSARAGRKRGSGERDGPERGQQPRQFVLWLGKTDLPCFVRDLRRRPQTLNRTINGPEAVVVAGTPSMDAASNLAGPYVATGFRDVVRHGNRGVFCAHPLLKP